MRDHAGIVSACEQACERSQAASNAAGIDSKDAARIAYRELVRWMSADYGFDEIDAYMFLSQAGRIRLGNMVDPKYTMGASVLKKYLIP